MIDRVNQLTPGTKPLWDKMDIAQMLAHCRQPIEVTFGNSNVKGSFILKLIGPLFKSVLYNEKTYTAKGSKP